MKCTVDIDSKEYEDRFLKHYDELKWLYCELYQNNMTAFEKMMHTIGLNKSLYRRVFSPNLFLKMGISKLDKLNHSFFPVSFDEIDEVLKEIKSLSSKVNINNIAEKTFYDIPVQLTIIYEYITIEFINNLSMLLKKFPNISFIKMMK